MADPASPSTLEATPETKPENAPLFSVRIVSIDYYMAPPIAGLDFSYSSLHEGKIVEVPVIRVYGATPGGQKTCLHVHRALPYFYIPCPDDPWINDEKGDASIMNLMNCIEKALKNKSSSGPKRQHIHGYSLVRAKDLYGYHSSEALFIKIYLYYPYDVARAADLLLGGAVLSRTFQPYESHIPYLLQFLVDCNLYGMSHIHTSFIKFRPPLPDALNSKAANMKNHATEVLVARQPEPAALWLSSTVSSDLLWPDLATAQGLIGKDNIDHSRQSTCELEADCCIDDIMNGKDKMNISFSQARSEVKMVQSLVPIWEEFKHSGLQEQGKLSELIKPNPFDILKGFLQSGDYESAISELFIQTQEAIGQNVSLTNESDNLKVNGSLTLEDKETLLEDEVPRLASMFRSPLVVAAEDQKNLSTEALGLLHWLASSQAAEDLNTDDELGHEAILTPLFSRSSYQEALETAHLDYEHASQQECQDILDSVECNIKNVLKEHNHLSGNEPSTSDSVDDKIPQNDGSSDDTFGPHQKVDQSALTMDTAKEESSAGLTRQASRRLSRNKNDTILWGPLPLSTRQIENKESESTAVSSCENDLNYNRPFDRKQEKCLIPANLKREAACDNVGATLSPCSARDLMRIKRSCKTEVIGYERSSEKDSSEKEISQGKFASSVGQSSHTTLDALHEGPASVVQDNLTLSTACTETQLKPPSPCRKQSDSLGHGLMDISCIQNLGDVSDSFIDKQPVQYVEMTFSRKPPSKDEVDGVSDDSHPSTRGKGNANYESLVSGQILADRVDFNECLPFFERCEENKLFESFQDVDINSIHESSLGIPMHFQNDGSVLYLLTHAESAPSFDSVQKWCLEVDTGSSDHSGGDLQQASPVLLPSPPHKSNYCENADEVSERERLTCLSGAKSGGSFQNCSQECVLDRRLNTNLSSLSQQTKKPDPSMSFAAHLANDEQKLFHSGNKCDSDSWHDISQISGPDDKLNSTPLSQIGFRDPASIGGGQQLTLLSLEVQAESRGKLLPDPQFDAINVLSLIVQEDTSPVYEVYLLMHGKDYEICGSRNIDGISDCKTFFFSEEKDLLHQCIKIISSVDPDILMGWEIQGGSLGFLAERAAHLGIRFLKNISRTPIIETEQGTGEVGHSEPSDAVDRVLLANSVREDAIIDDEWGRTHASGIHVGGRVVLNVWRLIRSEVKLNMYTIEAVAEEVLRRKVPSIPNKILSNWYSSGPGQTRYRCAEYIIERAKLNLQIMDQLDMINRTAELARVFGIDFFSVLSRGSQFRVESMLLRLAHTQNYVAISPGKQQVALQPAMECLPLVMEPESKFYADPVVVLDFQSLYPSMIIAYNLCFSTCLGKVIPSKSNILGVRSYSADMHSLKNMKEQLFLAPNGVMYVPAKVRKGVLPQLLDEILSTRIMVKQAMKKLMPSQKVLQRIYNARQLALKLIANVTYGYTAAGFSGRMPCAELADSIVQCGRRTLETAISFVNEHPKWNARVVYGDTDSMFVLLKGRSLEAAFKIGNEIASAITNLNPWPITLKLEKVYQPCFLLTKKRYVGNSYESHDQKKPTFDAKGIETVRRDTCPAVAKTLEQAIKLIFEHQDILEVKDYLHRQWTRILLGKVSIQDFIFAKEVRLGSYSARGSALPPAAIVAVKAMNNDRRAEPRYGERVPYVVVHGEPGARLIDMVIDPHELLEIDSQYRLNDMYYIRKQIIPALQRVFGLVGVDLNKWFLEMPRPVRPSLAKRNVSYYGSLHDYDDGKVAVTKKLQHKRSRIDTYYMSKYCALCGGLVQQSKHICDKCRENKSFVAAAIVGKTSRLEKDIQHLVAICQHCGGGDWILESGVKCTSLACSIFYERRKVQKELKVNSFVAGEVGLYPHCMVEWF